MIADVVLSVPKFFLILGCFGLLGWVIGKTSD